MVEGRGHHLDRVPDSKVSTALAAVKFILMRCCLNDVEIVDNMNLGQYSDIISRWESITLNLVNEQTWTHNKAKVCFIENLLGENEKKMWIQWRMAYPNEYDELVNIADDPQNILSQVRRMILLEDPTTGSIEEQNRAYEDLERLSVKLSFNMFKIYLNSHPCYEVHKVEPPHP
ncbi:hypothetical protein Cni_G09823 [Canna indica]|uniref:Uncharacterized protein n=1 Tax=Canna indica TaxID=4628 RepID=A0AAQ3QA18_9LILI|nr:hypothetical protein Cni_G09823 [Canna indica]